MVDYVSLRTTLITGKTTISTTRFKTRSRFGSGEERISSLREKEKSMVMGKPGMTGLPEGRF